MTLEDFVRMRREKLPSLNFHAIFGTKDKPQENPLTTHSGEVYWDYSKYGGESGTIAKQYEKNDIFVSEEVYVSRDALCTATVYKKMIILVTYHLNSKITDLKKLTDMENIRHLKLLIWC